MIKKIIILLLSLMTRLCCLQADNIDIFVSNAEEGKILNQFFKMGVEDEEYGYVLAGVKPISIRNFYSLDAFPISSTEETSQNEFMKTLLVQAAIPLWNKLCSHQEKFVLKAVSTTISPSVEGEIELMLINISKLREVVEKNIYLFRYILDPSLTIDQIVNKIAYSEESLTDILKQDLVLTGIVLGFGTHNSLLGGRAEEILAASFSKDSPPFSPKSYLIQKRCFPGLDFLIPENYGHYFLDLAGGEGSLVFKDPSSPKASFNFPNIEKELLFLKSMEMRLPSCLRTPPLFVFSAFKGGSFNEPFFNLLQQTQKQIQDLIKKPDFLAQVLEEIGGKTPYINIDEASLAQKPYLGKILNTSQWDCVLSSVAGRFKEKSDQSEFAYNFCHSHEPAPQAKIMFVSRATIKGLKLSIQNLEKANDYFESISKHANRKETFQEVFRGKVYFKTVVQGDKEEVKGAPSIRINYIVGNTEGEIFFADCNTWIPISNSITGFAHGVQGMKIGEKRTISIHPSFGYGSLTTLPLCETLVIKVHLLEIKEAKTPKDLPPLEPLDLSWIQNPSFYKEIQEAVKQQPKLVGAFYREILDKIEGVDKKFLINNICENFCADHSSQTKSSKAVN